MLELLLRITRNSASAFEKQLGSLAVQMESKFDDLAVVDFGELHQDWYMNDDLVVRISCDFSERINLIKNNRTTPVECTLSSLADHKRLSEGSVQECYAKLAEILEGELAPL